MFSDLVVRVLAMVVGFGGAFSAGVLLGYRYEHSAWQAADAARAVVAQKADDERKATELAQAEITERVNHEAQDQIAAMSKYISDFLRKPAAAGSRAVPQAPASPIVIANDSGGCPSQPANPALSIVPAANIDSDTAGACAAGWEEVMQWRAWARAQGMGQ